MEKGEENGGKFNKKENILSWKEKERISQKTEWYILVCYFATLWSGEKRLWVWSEPSGVWARGL